MPTLNVVAIIGVESRRGTLYQIGSRKQQRVRFKIKERIVALVAYLVAAFTNKDSRLWKLPCGLGRWIGVCMTA